MIAYSRQIQESTARGDLLLRAEGYRGPSVLTFKYLHSYTKKTASPVRRVLNGGAVLSEGERERPRQSIPKIIEIQKIKR